MSKKNQASNEEKEKIKQRVLGILDYFQINRIPHADAVDVLFSAYMTISSNCLDKKAKEMIGDLQKLIKTLKKVDGTEEDFD